MSSLNQEINAEGDIYLTKKDLLKLAGIGVNQFKLYPHKRIVIKANGKESSRTFGKGERVRLVTKTPSEFDNIFRGRGLLTKPSPISRYGFASATCSDDVTHEFLVVERNGEDMVYVEDVFPISFGRTKNVFPRYYWIEVTRLIQIGFATSNVPYAATEQTDSLYLDEEMNDKTSDDIARELFLVEELGHAHNTISDLEFSVTGWRTQCNLLQKTVAELKEKMKSGSMDSFEQLGVDSTEISPTSHHQSSSLMNRLHGSSHSQSSSSSSSQMGFGGGIVTARKAHSRELEIENARLRTEIERLREEQTRLQQTSSTSSTSHVRRTKTEIRKNVLKDVIAASKLAENQLDNDEIVGSGIGSGSSGPLASCGMGMTTGVSIGCSYEAENNRDHKAKMRKVTPYKEG